MLNGFKRWFVKRLRWSRMVKIYILLVIVLLCLYLFNSGPHLTSKIPTPVAEKLEYLSSTLPSTSDESNSKLNKFQGIKLDAFKSGTPSTKLLNQDNSLQSSIVLPKITTSIYLKSNLPTTLKHSNPSENSNDGKFYSEYVETGYSRDVTEKLEESNSSISKDVETDLTQAPPVFFIGLPIGRISAIANLKRPDGGFTLSQEDFLRSKPTKEQLIVRDAMQHSWKNYKRYAWGHDMLKPRTHETAMWFNLGLTIVDSADTLIMMGMTQEAQEAIYWIEEKLDFDKGNENSNCFELTIRILGGLLSVYHLVPREGVLTKATDIGARLLNCYNSHSKVVPLSDIDLATRYAHSPVWDQRSSLSEVSSIQLEFRDLSRLTNDQNFEKITFRTSLHLHKIVRQRNSSILPMYIDPNNGQVSGTRYTLGARCDSYYEYLLKSYLQTGIEFFVDDYLDAIDEISLRMVAQSQGPKNLTFVGELQEYNNQYKTSGNESVTKTQEYGFYAKMDHLVCFIPGTLALGYYHFSPHPKAHEYRLRYELKTHRKYLDQRFDKHLDFAIRLARTCWHMYNETSTGLAPEIAQFASIDGEPDLIIQPSSAHNLLRPEYVESLFYLYHITHDDEYLHQAKSILESFNRHARLEGGYSPIADVRQTPVVFQSNGLDRMESFWMSETLKYLYLTFSDDTNIIRALLNHYVFNTEGHIIPRQQSPVVSI